MQQTPIISCCYYKSQRNGLYEVRNCREAAVPEKETKILEKETRGDKGSPEQNESPIPDLSNALWFVSLVRVVVEILILKKFYSIFSKKKRPGQLGLGNSHYGLSYSMG